MAGDLIRLLGFQSTRPRGARPTWAFSSGDRSLFQSTRPRGARPEAIKNPSEYLRFQSTRPRGARLGTGPSESLWKGFNPRARAGRDATSIRSSKC